MHDTRLPLPFDNRYPRIYRIEPNERVCPWSNVPFENRSTHYERSMSYASGEEPNRSGHVAQWIARWTSDPEVVGSSPTLIDFFFGIGWVPLFWSSLCNVVVVVVVVLCLRWFTFFAVLIIVCNCMTDILPAYPSQYMCVHPL